MVRVRFAPSPSGSIHIGNARTALYNWLMARRLGGKFILRIENTDVERSTPEAEASILEDLRWLGLDWDEGPEKGGEYGPYRQLERIDLYQKEAEKLQEKGMAYPCFCTPEFLEKKRKDALAKGFQPHYDGTCWRLSETERNKRMEKGEPYSVRFHIRSGSVQFHDLVLGDINFETENIGDLIIIRSDGRASYNFAVVVDDYLMKITHVIRGNDHLSNTPKQLLLFEALGYTPPVYGHVALITGQGGAPLSKRDGATSVIEYRNLGILPEALCNFLSLLGWSSPSGEEIIPLAKLIEEFDIERVHKSAAFFDFEKLKWMNGNYIRKISPDILGKLIEPYLTKAGLKLRDAEQLTQVAQAIQEKIELLSQAPEWAGMMIGELSKPVDEETLVWITSHNGKKVLEEFITGIDGLQSLNHEQFVEILKGIQKITGFKTKQIMMPLRVALTGKTTGPEVKVIIDIVGLETCRKRIRKVLNK